MVNVETQLIAETVIESLPDIEPQQTVVDQAQKILIETFSPMLRAIAKQIKETGSVAARALEGLDVIQLLAIQDIVEELSGT